MCLIMGIRISDSFEPVNWVMFNFYAQKTRLLKSCVCVCAGTVLVFLVCCQEGVICTPGYVCHLSVMSVCTVKSQLRYYSTAKCLLFAESRILCQAHTLELNSECSPCANRLFHKSTPICQ
jgi:hypothetical protein